MIKIRVSVIATLVLFAFVIPASAGRIHKAAERGDVAKVNSLLAKDPKLVEAKDNKYGWTPLHCAAIYGQREMAEVLIARGAKVNEKDNEGRTPLHYAARHGRKEVVDVLRKHGGVE